MAARSYLAVALLVLLGMASGVLGGCRSQESARLWRNPAVAATIPVRVTVAAAVRPASARNDLEGALVLELRRRGFVAEPSVGAIAFEDLEMRPDVLARQLGASERGGFLVARIFDGDRRTEARDRAGWAELGKTQTLFPPVPERSDSFWKTHDRYDTATALAGRPSVRAGYHSSDEQQAWEVVLFDAATGQPARVAYLSVRAYEGESPDRRCTRIARAMAQALELRKGK